MGVGPWGTPPPTIIYCVHAAEANRVVRYTEENARYIRRVALFPKVHVQGEAAFMAQTVVFLNGNLLSQEGGGQGGGQAGKSSEL